MLSQAHCSILLARVVVPTYSQPIRMSRIYPSAGGVRATLREGGGDVKTEATVW